MNSLSYDQSPFPRHHHFPLFHHHLTTATRRLSSSRRAKSTQTEFTVAKLTHPDLVRSDDQDSHSDASRRFVQILAASEILSDRERRAHYDRDLLSQWKLMQRRSSPAGGTTELHLYKFHSAYRGMEVVEWLKWYRVAISDVLAERKVVVGTGYFDVLERDFYLAINAAYYGPEIESIDCLPDCFEAEERSVCETPEVLHLVSGRDVFGMVCVVDEVPELAYSNKRLNYFTSGDIDVCQSDEDLRISMSSGGTQRCDPYKDLELHISGRVVATATRVPPQSCCDMIHDEDADHIHIYLSSDDNPMYTSKGFTETTSSDSPVGSRILLGTITGLQTSSEEGSCLVYNSSGTKTHVIMKHRTLLVKHMHWYGLGDNASVCECRCTRARLPPSKRLVC